MRAQDDHFGRVDVEMWICANDVGCETGEERLECALGTGILYFGYENMIRKCHVRVGKELACKRGRIGREDIPRIHAAAFKASVWKECLDTRSLDSPVNHLISRTS